MAMNTTQPPATKISGGEAAYNAYLDMITELCPYKKLKPWFEISHPQKAAWQSAAQHSVMHLIGHDLRVTPETLQGMPGNFAYDVPGEDDESDEDTDDEDYAFRSVGDDDRISGEVD